MAAQRVRLGPTRNKSLSSVCCEALIIAHTEDTTQLDRVLKGAGFQVQVLRGPYTDEQKRFSPQIQVLVNHAHAWRHASRSQYPTIVMEADFVPCIGFGGLPLPFGWSASCKEPKFGWLYSSGSILYGIDAEGFPHGHGNTAGAYVLNSLAAEALLEFYEKEIKTVQPGEYRLWDTYLGIFLRWDKGILNYIPIYQYGEHGGIPNKGHKNRCIKGWNRKVRGWHQADVLWNRLTFLPMYARQSQLLYRLFRIRARLRGWARLLTLRFFDPRSTNADSSRGRFYMLTLSIARLLGLAHLICAVAEAPNASRLDGFAESSETNES
jgi:hypothetical protein